MTRGARWLFCELMPCCKKTGERSKTGIYNRVKEGVFTKSVPIGQRITGWPDHEVETIVAAQVAGQTPEQIRGLVKSLHAQRAEHFKMLTQGVGQVQHAGG